MSATSLKSYLGMFGRGLMKTALPDVAEGVILTMLEKADFNLDIVRQMVKDDKSLWETISDKHVTTLRQLKPYLGNIDWFTLEWLLGVAYKRYPQEVKHIINSPAMLEWLEKQRKGLIEIIMSDSGGV